MGCNKGILLDRDGVVIADRPDYVREVSHVTILPGVIQAMHKLWLAGYTICMVTNQAGIAKNLYSHETVATIHRFLEKELRLGSHQPLFWYYCPHRDEDNCQCRKPKPGLLLTAMSDHHFEPAQTWMVGDSQRDLEAGIQAGCHVALVRTGHGKNFNFQQTQIHPELVCDNLASFVDFLLR